MEPSRRPGGVAAALDRVVPGGVTGQRLRIDDRTLSCVAAGHGAPVVVLEAGRNDNALSWAAVILLLAPHVRVVAYDRAGLGDSDLASSPASIDRQVTDLVQPLSSPFLVAVGLAGYCSYSVRWTMAAVSYASSGVPVYWPLLRIASS